MHDCRYEGVSAAGVFQYFIAALALALISDVPDTFGAACVAAKALLYSLLFVSLLLPTRHALVFLLMITIVGQDIVQTLIQQEADALLTASIWQGQIGPLRPSWVIMLYCSILLIKSRVFFVDRPVVYAALWFATVPFITAWLYGSFQTPVASREILIDAKIPLFLITSILLFRNWLKTDPGSAGAFAAALLGAVMARAAIDSAYAILRIGALYGDVVRVSVDSTKGTTVFLLLFSVCLILRCRRFFVGGFLGIMSVPLLVIYCTRGLWLSAILGVLLLFRMMRIDKLLLFAPIVAVLFLGGLYVLAAMFPGNMHLAATRLDEQTRYRADNLVERYFPTRYVQIVNAGHVTFERGAVLWGSGYGSYYTESAVRFPPTMHNAFPEYSMESGQFYHVHNFVFRSLFEYGIVGFLLLANLWLVPGWRCFKALRNPPPDLFSLIIVSMIAFLPTSMLELSWTSKGMIVSGFAIAFYMSACERLRARIDASKLPAARPRANRQALFRNQNLWRARHSMRRPSP